MRAVILAGGKGTRLAPYTTVLPKPLMPVGERPILELVLRQLAGHGFERVDLSVGHLGQLIKTYFDQIELPASLRLEYHWEDEPLGTAGALRTIEDLSEPFLVMNGDVLTNLDFAEFMRFHAGQDSLLTVATHSKDVRIDLGVVESANGLINDYIEKPTMHYEVSMGIYAYDPRALEYIPPSYFDFPDVVKALIAAEERVAIYRSQDRWFDIGTPDDHQRAVAEIEKSPALFDA
jgi:NDP-sugar pyrophosphorylase family protein